MSDSEWCPSVNGKTRAWQPEYFDLVANEWKEVPYKKLGADNVAGIPYPSCFGGLFEFVGLCGKEQAWALAWGYAALCKANSMHTPEVRVSEYEFVYEIKARKKDAAK